MTSALWLYALCGWAAFIGSLAALVVFTVAARLVGWADKREGVPWNG